MPLATLLRGGGASYCNGLQPQGSIALSDRGIAAGNGKNRTKRTLNPVGEHPHRFFAFSGEIYRKESEKNYDFLLLSADKFVIME